MNPASALTDLLFIALVGVVAGLFLHAGRRARDTTRGGPDASVPRLAPGARVSVLLLYLGVPAVLVGVGALDRYDPLPAPALLLLLALTLVTVGLALSSFGVAFASSLSLAALIGYQVFRVPVEWLLHRLYLDGVIPVQMTYAGRNFDIVSGITAGLLAFWLASGRPAPRRVVLVWNVVGLALLANIVTVAVLSTPVPFRVFHEGPPNLVPSTFPHVWLPSFLVQAALFGHVLVFRRLRAHGKGTALALVVALIGAAPVRAEADARAGEEKAQLCLLCHKPNNPANYVPTLEGQTREYLYNQIKAYRDKRRPDLYMQTNVASLSDEDIRDIAAYFASRPPVRASFALDADAIARGRSVAGRLGCGTCHKPAFSGEGDVPRLAGLEPRYARLQLLDLAAGKRPHPHVNGLSGLSPEDAEGLAQFFAHLE